VILVKEVEVEREAEAVEEAEVMMIMKNLSQLRISIEKMIREIDQELSKVKEKRRKFTKTIKI
jgi:TusA-related sulfurtransferase